MNGHSDKLICHYNKYDESGRMFGSNARSLEFHATLHFLDEAVSESSTVLELGAGCGAYTKYLAGKVQHVHTSDLVPEYVKTLGEQFKHVENVTVGQIDATNFIPPHNTYDCVLCMGPLYHLQQPQQRKAVIHNCSNALSANGKIFFSYVNRHYALSLYLKNRFFFNAGEYELFLKGDFAKLAEKDPFMGFSYYTTPEEIAQEITACGLKICRHAGVDGHYNLISQAMDCMSEKEFDDFLQYHIRTCESPSSLGISSHGLIVCSKE